MMESKQQQATSAGGARVMPSSGSVVQQARLMDSAGTAWHAVKCGSLEMITKLFPNRSNVYAKGPVGENVLHVAMLLNTPSTLAITRYLVKLFGAQLVNCPIQERRTPHDAPGTYEGQTALHIAIVNRDFDMVKFLVQHGANIRVRAWGTFFRHDGPMYYGEFPLSFAVCTGQKDIVAYLTRHGAQVNSDRDAFGNTALHMAVIHDQPDMYDFLVDFCGADVEVPNHSGLTALVLAAHLGKMDMFKHITSRRRRTFYSFGKVTSYSLSLREIDTVQEVGQGPDGGYVPNALEAVVRKRHLHMLQEPLLSTLLNHKWEAFARAQFLLHFAGYLLLEISQTILIWLISDQDEWNRGPRASQEFVGVFLALLMLVVEVIDYVNWSRECYHRRLTMTMSTQQDHPLYPIPGEMFDVRDSRQGLFARLSARMGFSHPSSGNTHTHSSSHHSRPSGTGSATAAAAYAASKAVSGHGKPPQHPPPAAADGGIHHQQQQQQQQQLLSQQQQQQPSRLGLPNAASNRRMTGPFIAAAVTAAADQPPQTPQASQQQQRQQQQDQSASPATPTATIPGPGATTTVSAARASSGQLSPTRSSVQRFAVSDTPINLETYSMGGTVVGAGKSVFGVGLVDSGLTASSLPAEGSNQEAAGAARSPRPATASPAVGRMSRPLGEGLEDGGPEGDAAIAAAVAAAAGLDAAGLQQQQPRQLAESDGSSRHQRDDDDVDVVSVGLPINRVRSLHSSTAALGTTPDHSGSGVLGSPVGVVSPTAVAAANSAPADIAAAAAAAGPLDDFRDGSTSGVRQPRPSQQQQRVSFADQVSSPRASTSSAGQQQQQQQQQLPSTDMWSTSQQQQQPPLLYAGPAGQPMPGVSQLPMQGGELLLSADPSAASAVGPSAAAGSSPMLLSGFGSGGLGIGQQTGGKVVPVIPRSKSFHGTTGLVADSAAAAAVGGSAAGQQQGLLELTRAGTGDLGHAGQVKTLATTSHPAESHDAVLERQRTRFRSGGGDLGPGLALTKRTHLLSKKTPTAPSDIGSPQYSADGQQLLPAGTPISAAGVTTPSAAAAAKTAAAEATTPAAAAAAAAVAAAAGAGGGGGGSDGGGGGGGFVGSGRLSGKWSSGDVDQVLNGHGGDMERIGSGGILDPHKTRFRALLETSYEGAVRMVEDPWLFVWHLHLLLTLIHFLTWISSYGWVGGPGPQSITVRQFDDVIVSMMGLSGWLAVIYFFRGFQPTGKLAYILERCIADVLKFVSLFVLWDIGFTLAFYTIQHGVLGVTGVHDTRRQTDYEIPPFSSMGYTMVTLINVGAGLGHGEYNSVCVSDYTLSMVMCTFYYLLYMATVVLLLMNLLTAMIITTWQTNQVTAAAHWKHRWAIYVLKAERRLPASWAQRLRLGQPAWDQKLHKEVYSHVFETVGDDADGSTKGSVDSQIKALEVTLDELRKRKTA